MRRKFDTRYRTRRSVALLLLMTSTLFDSFLRRRSSHITSVERTCNTSGLGVRLNSFKMNLSLSVDTVRGSVQFRVARREPNAARLSHGRRCYLFLSSWLMTDSNRHFISRLLPVLHNNKRMNASTCRQGNS